MSPLLSVMEVVEDCPHDDFQIAQYRPILQVLQKISETLLVHCFR